jgi:TPR repeat protein
LFAWLVAFLLLLVPAAGVDFEAGKRAYEQGDYAAALTELGPLAEQGNPKAEILLGNMHARGLGVPVDHVKAFKWFQAAADKGSADGQLQVGLAYLSGAAGMKDAARALKWLKLSAGQGNPDAQVNLGLAYRNLKGIPHDYVEAWMWFELATQRGDPLAPRQRDSLQRSMTPQQLDDARAKAAAWKPTKLEPRP